MYLVLPSPKVVAMSSYLTVLQQANVILSAGPLVIAMGAVLREQEKLQRKVVWEGKKIVQNLTGHVIKGAPDA